MLAHERKGDLRGDTAKGAGICADVDEVPCTAVSQTGLSCIKKENFQKLGDSWSSLGQWIGTFLGGVMRLLSDAAKVEVTVFSIYC